MKTSLKIIFGHFFGKFGIFYELRYPIQGLNISFYGQKIDPKVANFDVSPKMKNLGA